jgi:hypothetical protein
MRTRPRLGAANLALLSIYFVPTWGGAALKTLISPYVGFEGRVHAAAAGYFHRLFDLGFDGMVLMSSMLAGLKLIVAAAFFAYLIEFARALAVGREPDQATQDVVLGLAVVGTALWVLPTLSLDDPALVRLYATQVLLVAGAVVVSLIDRPVERPAEASSLQPMTVGLGQTATATT